MPEETNRKPSPHGMILQAAVDTISNSKISGARMREIARAAGMSQGNLHYYFPSKSSLFLAVLDHMLQTFVKGRKDELTAATADPTTKLNVFLRQQKDIILHSDSLLKVRLDFWVQGTKNPEIKQKIQEMYRVWRHDIEEVVAEGVREGVFDARQAALAPNLLVALMEGAALQYLIDSDAVDLEAYFATAHEMVMRLLLRRPADGA